MEYTITPLTPHTGAEVRGIDLNEGVDAETRAALNRAFAEHHVLVVRGQQFTPPQFIAAAQVFGELFQLLKGFDHLCAVYPARRRRISGATATPVGLVRAGVTGDAASARSMTVITESDPDTSPPPHRASR